MTNEIKEILEALKSHNDNFKDIENNIYEIIDYLESKGDE